MTTSALAIAEPQMKGMVWARAKHAAAVALAAAIVAGAAGEAFAAQDGTPGQDPKAAEKKGFLTIKDGRFWKDGKPFSIRASCCDPAVGHWFKFKGPWLKTGIESCEKYGFNAIRTWVPGTGDAEDAATYGRWSQNREAFYREFDAVFVDPCRDKGLFLILTLTELPSGAAPGSRYDLGSPAYAAWKRFAQDFCGRYKDEAAILFWETCNEYRGAPDNLPATRRFYEQAARDLRAADPNHLISSGVDVLNWPDWQNARNVWKNINGSEGIDIASGHQYTDDGATYNWHTERDYVRMVRGYVAAAREVGKPLFLGEFGVAPRFRSSKPTVENPELVWCLKALIREGVQAYGFHWFYPWEHSWSGAGSARFGLNPSESPQTAQWMKELNQLAAQGREVPKDFGPKTTDFAFPICVGPKAMTEVFAGPAPKAGGQAKVEADKALFGAAAPSVRLTWDGASVVALGPYHPNDLSEYLEAGGNLRFAIRGDRESARNVRVFVKDAKGAAGAVQLASILPGGKLSRQFARVAVPMKELRIDWAAWASFGLEFPANTSGVIHIDDVEVVCGH